MLRGFLSGAIGLALASTACSDDGGGSASPGSGGLASGGGSGGAGVGTGGRGGTETGGGGSTADPAVDCATRGPNCLSVSGTILGRPFLLNCLGEQVNAARVLGDDPAWSVNCSDDSGNYICVEVPVLEPLPAAGVTENISHTIDAQSPSNGFRVRLPEGPDGQPEGTPRSYNFVTATLSGSVTIRAEDSFAQLVVSGSGSWGATDACEEDTFLDAPCIEGSVHVSYNALFP